MLFHKIVKYTAFKMSSNHTNIKKTVDYSITLKSTFVYIVYITVNTYCNFICNRLFLYYYIYLIDLNLSPVFIPEHP